MARIALRLCRTAVFVLAAIAAQAQTDPRAQMTSPIAGSTLPGSTVTFTWSAAAGGGDYFLRIGSQPFGTDIFNAVVRVTSVTLINIPTNGGTIYLDLYTQIKGQWHTPLSYTYKAANLVAPATTAVDNKAVTFSATSQNVTLTATIAAGSAVNQGTITFQVKDGAANVGSPVVSATLMNGSASVAYALPAGTAAKNYTIQASYSGGANFQSSSGTGTLTVAADPAFTLTFNFPPDGASSTSSGAGALSVGYAQISSPASANPVAIANFAYTAGGMANGLGRALVTEAGVPAATLVTSARIFVDYGAGANSGFALVNPNNDAITIKADLKDFKGTTLASSTLPIGPRSHTAMFVNQLMPNLPSLFLGTLTLTSANEFAAVNLSAVTNGRAEMLYSTLPVTDLGRPPTGTSLILPQVVDGGGSPTQILLMNPSGTTESIGTVQLFDDQGSPLALDFGNTSGPQSSLDFTIPPDGAVKFATTGKGILRAGYAVVTVSSGLLPVEGGIFQFKQASELVSQAGVPDSPQTTSARMYVETASAPLFRDTGIAMVNRNATASSLILTLEGFDGTSHEAALSLGPNQHVAKFITELFPGMLPADFRGVLNITSTQPNSYLTLRLTINERGEPIYSTLPVADLNNPPQGVQFLPQIVNGGGFKTQTIVIGTSTGPDTIYISYYDETGKGVPLTSIQ